MLPPQGDFALLGVGDTWGKWETEKGGGEGLGEIK